MCVFVRITTSIVGGKCASIIPVDIIDVCISFLTYKFAQDLGIGLFQSNVIAALIRPISWKCFFFVNKFCLCFIRSTRLFFLVFCIIRFCESNEKIFFKHFINKIRIDIRLSRKYLSINQIFKIDDKFYFIFNPIINTLV